MRTSTSLGLQLLAVLFLFAGVSALADDHTDWGPEIGTTMPDGLTVTTHDGKSMDLHDLATGKGVAIAFVRSADWCPFCKRQMIDLNKNREEFARRGVNLVALSYDSVDVLKAFADKQGIGYTLASDQDSKVIDAFGIRNKDHDKGTSGYGIPHPGIMVFDATCTLVAKYAEEGYRKRPPIEDVLAAVDRHLAN